MVEKDIIETKISEGKEKAEEWGESSTALYHLWGRRFPLSDKCRV